MHFWKTRSSILSPGFSRSTLQIPINGRRSQHYVRSDTVQGFGCRPVADYPPLSAATIGRDWSKPGHADRVLALEREVEPEDQSDQRDDRAAQHLAVALEYAEPQMLQPCGGVDA